MDTLFFFLLNLRLRNCEGIFCCEELEDRLTGIQIYLKRRPKDATDLEMHRIQTYKNQFSRHFNTCYPHVPDLQREYLRSLTRGLCKLQQRSGLLPWKKLKGTVLVDMHTRIALLIRSVNLFCDSRTDWEDLGDIAGPVAAIIRHILEQPEGCDLHSSVIFAITWLMLAEYYTVPDDVRSVSKWKCLPQWVMDLDHLDEDLYDAIYHREKIWSLGRTRPSSYTGERVLHIVHRPDGDELATEISHVLNYRPRASHGLSIQQGGENQRNRRKAASLPLSLPRAPETTNQTASHWDPASLRRQNDQLSEELSMVRAVENLERRDVITQFNGEFLDAQLLDSRRRWQAQERAAVERRRVFMESTVYSRKGLAPPPYSA